MDSSKRQSLQGHDIDNLLNEIDQNITKKINWLELETKIKMGKASSYIKSMISSKEYNINEKNPSNGMTLLFYAVIIGDLALVKTICDFGGNLSIKDAANFTPLDYAKKYGRYNVTELLFYQTLSASLGRDLKNVSTQIYEKQKEAKFYASCHQNATDFMVKVMKNRAPFSGDLLFYAWQSVQSMDDPLQSELFKAMMTTYSEILSNTKDSEGWKWLKRYFVPSLIWYMKHPHCKDKDKDDTKQEEEKETKDELDDANNMEPLLKTTLFWELLIRVREESKKQSDLLLKEKIDKIKAEQPKKWNNLTEFNVTSKYSKNARQDVCGCLIPEFTVSDLNKYGSSTHFSPKKHYDKQIYLNRLLFNANLLDDAFQKDMKAIAMLIQSQNKNNISVTYRAGPVKTLTRSQTKVENDYINETWPTAAKILDINRCALQFETVNGLMLFLDGFQSKIKDNANNQYCIREIIRCKNGWTYYNELLPGYTDVKLNVLIQKSEELMVVGEIQLLLNLMSSFKKVAHKLYSVERNEEFTYNFAKMRSVMEQFKDNVAVISLAIFDDLHSFVKFWDFVPNERIKLLMDSFAIFYILQQNGEILKYLLSEYKSCYDQAVELLLDTNDVSQLVKEANKAKMEKAQFVKVLFDSLGDNKQVIGKLADSVLILAAGNIKVLKTILDNKYISEKRKFELFEKEIQDKNEYEDGKGKTILFHCLGAGRYGQGSDCAVEIVKYIENHTNDASKLKKLFFHEISEELNLSNFALQHGNDSFVAYILDEIDGKMFSNQDKYDWITGNWADITVFMNQIWEWIKKHFGDKALISILTSINQKEQDCFMYGMFDNGTYGDEAEYMNQLEYFLSSNSITNKEKYEILTYKVLAEMGFETAWIVANRSPPYALAILNFIRENYNENQQILDLFQFKDHNLYTVPMVWSKCHLEYRFDEEEDEEEDQQHFFEEHLIQLTSIMMNAFINGESSDILYSLLKESKDRDGNNLLQKYPLTLWTECLELLNVQKNINSITIKTFDSLRTNPFITACIIDTKIALDKMIKIILKEKNQQEIMRLMMSRKKYEYVIMKPDETDETDDEKEKEKAYDSDDSDNEDPWKEFKEVIEEEPDMVTDKLFVEGNNVFYFIAMKGYNDIISDILNILDDQNKKQLLLAKNKMNQTLLADLVQNDENVKVLQTICKGINDKKIILELFNEKQNENGNNCQQIAAQSGKSEQIIKFIQTFT